MRNLTRFPILFIVAAILLPGITRADGMIVQPVDYSMYESGQQAVLFYEEETQTETLVISMQFRGDAKDFAWIIPVPGKPTISRGSTAVFTSLEGLTGGRYAVMPYAAGLGGAEDTKTQSVNVVSKQSIDYYDITTLTADDSSALADWLRENGYYYPVGSSYILNSYVTNGWYFVAVKINAENVSISSIESNLREGNATPLKLVFSAKNPVYPLRISSVMSDTTKQRTVIAPASSDLQPGTQPTSVIVPGNTWRPKTIPVELYVIAEHKKSIPGFSTTYGNWVKRDDIALWAVDGEGNPLLQAKQGKYFLTKLSRQMTYEQMTEDLFPKDAKNNDKVGTSSMAAFSFENTLLFLLAISIYTAIVFFIGLFSPFGIAFIIATVLYVCARSRTLRVLAWVIQYAVGVVYMLTAFVILIASLQNSSMFLNMSRSILSADYDSFAANSVWSLTLIVPVLAFLALCVLVMVFQRRWRRNRESRLAQKGSLPGDR